MNCSDISLILDDRDTAALDDGIRMSVDAHVAACPDCSRDWKLHARLVARKLPAVPPDLIDDCIALAVAAPASDRNRGNRRRTAMTASIVLVVAAAAVTLYRAAGPDTAEVISAPRSSQEVPQAQVDSPSTAHNPATSTTQATESDTFSVLLTTLQDDTLEAADKTVFDTFRTATIDELRRTPGLVLVLAEASASEPVVDYEITISAMRRNGRLNGVLRVSKSGPDRVVQPIQGAFGQDCAPSCFQDAASLGEALGRAAAKLMLPPATQPPALLEELKDSVLSPEQRLEALRDMDLRRSLGRSRLRRIDPSGDSLRDPAVMRAVIDLASVATNPAHRAEIWWTMRSIGNPGLVEPLAHAAQLDPDSTVRAEAVATLVADFASDPRVRAALDVIARADSHLMVRALAQRGLSGEATWNRYINTSLEDATLPDAQRLDALLFHVRSSDAAEQPLAKLLDDDAINALTQVLPRVAGAGTRTLLNHVVSLKHPAITRMLLASIERRDPRFDRKLVMDMLADRLSEPTVRAAFEKIAAADPDEQSRRTAAQALQK